jgi:hypothetical protein
MNRHTAETVADILIGAALLGAAIAVIRTPALRRLAWGLATTALTTTAPAWIGREVRDGWSRSARAAS